MTTITSVPLTAEQRERLHEPGDWLKLTEEQRVLVESCGPGEAGVLYGDAFVRTTREHFKAALDSAYKEAFIDAGMRARLRRGEEFEIAAEPLALGTTYVRMNIVCSDGRKATGVGKIPDPRAH